jgi:hypothetical protein
VSRTSRRVRQVAGRVGRGRWCVGGIGVYDMAMAQARGPHYVGRACVTPETVDCECVMKQDIPRVYVPGKLGDKIFSHDLPIIVHDGWWVSCVSAREAGGRLGGSK